ncbi:MAG: DUF3667 domain-containing protein [Betaproteobacteria bacterium]
MIAPPAHPAVSTATCTNCTTPLVGRYCQACGQDSIPDETALTRWRESWQRLWRTLHALILRPGYLTQQHLGGSRVRFIAPLTLFLNIVAVFFLFSVATEFRVQSFMRADSSRHLEQSLERRAERAGVSKDVFLERVERRFQSVYTLCLVSISLFGYTVLTRLVYRRHWRGWRGPFTFTLHYLAFIFIALPVVMIVVHGVSTIVYPPLLRMLAVVASGTIATSWLALASRRLFNERWPMALVKGAAIVLVGFVIDNAMFLTAVLVTFNLA